MPNNKNRALPIVILLCVLILLIIYLSLSTGIYPITWKDLYRSFFRVNPVPDIDLVLFDFRLPRIILAIFVGFGLGIAGAILQAITKNGLADPGILGINSGAGAAIVAYMFFFQGILQLNLDNWIVILTMPIIGLLGGLLAAFIIFLFAWSPSGLDSQRLILTGIAISSGFGSLSMYLSLKMKAQDFEMAAVWLNGSIYSANWLYILSIIPWFFLLLPIIIRKANMLDLFSLQEEVLTGLGVKVEKEKWLLLGSAVGLISACVSVSGSIGFIGLMAPHIARMLVGMKHQKSLIVCGLVGSLLMLIADFIGRTVVAPAEIAVGIVLSIIGVPYFIYLLIREKK